MSEGAIDYRLSCFSSARGKDIVKEKATLAAFLARQNSKRSDYDRIRESKSELHEWFLRIYDFKCSYCGVTTEIVSRACMEIDHLEPKSGCEEDDVAEKRRRDGVGNLVLACSFCNRSKSDYRLLHPELLNPDKSAITKLFFRDDNYYIRISKEFDSDKEITQFYKKLHLSFQIHRIDYILLTINSMVHDVLKDNPTYSNIVTELLAIKSILSDSRRCQNLSAGE